jgi:hypothetical protein
MRSVAEMRLFVALTVVLAATTVQAQSVVPPFDSDYTLVDLGPVPGLPASNGGLTFPPGRDDLLLIGGEANQASGTIYAIQVVRDLEGHITGFAGTATPYADGAYNDGGVVFGPEDVLFLARYPNNELGQVMSGSSFTAKVVDLAALGVTESPGGLGFVPDGFPGAGELKVASWSDGGFYTLSLAPDGMGTYHVLSASRETNVPGGPEGFIYVPHGSPRFADNQMLVSEWSGDRISVYDVDAGGNPLPGTRTLFVSDVNGPEGAAIDPRTGDFLFSSFTLENDSVLVVRGFVAPPAEEDPEDPEDPECERSDPVGPGYWHRQCMGVPTAEGGLSHGRGRGPTRTHEPGFATDLMSCADSLLQDLGVGTTVCEAIEADPPSDPCEQARRRLATLVLNVCSDRQRTSCTVESRCGAGTIGELLEEAAALIADDRCRKAAVCSASAHRRRTEAVEAASVSQGRGRGAGAPPKDR